MTQESTITAALPVDAGIHLDRQPVAGKLRKTSLLKLMLPMPAFHWHAAGSKQRAEVESYIASKFRDEYQANVSSYAPLLLSMSCKQKLSAAVGIRPAAGSTLFLEQYLEKPVEQYIKSSSSDLVNRDQVVEIGNLVVTRRGASQLLFIVIGSVLYEAGYRWLAFSATEKVERITRKFPFPVQVICSAKPECLGEDAKQWGRYYQTNPHVIVGDIKVAYEKAQKNRLLKMAIMFYRPLLLKLARTMPAIRLDDEIGNN